MSRERRDDTLLRAAKTLAHQLSNLTLLAEMLKAPEAKAVAASLLLATKQAKLLTSILDPSPTIRVREVTFAAWAQEWQELVAEPHGELMSAVALEVPTSLEDASFRERPFSLTALLLDAALQASKSGATLTISLSLPETLSGVTSGDYVGSFAAEIAARNEWRFETDRRRFTINFS